MRNKLPSISVIIPTYNSAETLIACIRSFEKQTIQPLEIIVVDNASTDETATRLKKLKTRDDFYKKKLKIFTHKENLGVTGGRNSGIKHSDKKSEYLFFFDHDMVADKNMLEELFAVASKKDDVGIVTPKIYYWGDKKRIWAAGTKINLWTGQILPVENDEALSMTKPQEVQVAPAALLVDKKVLGKIKKFDNRYFAVYEDTDFCFRARRAGYVTYYAPNAVAYHDLSTNPDDEADRLLRRAYWVGRNKVWFMRDFGRNYLVFLFFVPVYSLHYLLMALRRKNIVAWFSYLKGTFDGIF